MGRQGVRRDKLGYNSVDGSFWFNCTLWDELRNLFGVFTAKEQMFGVPGKSAECADAPSGSVCNPEL